MAEPKSPSAENPEKLLDLKRTPPPDAAAGLSAILISARHVVNELEVGRGVRALRKLNQKDGFDCPGCAWPDPDDERSSLGEFCENGVKAIAEEATSKKLTAEFFKSHSVQQLSELSDYEIGKMGRVAEPVYLAPGATHYEPMNWNDTFNLMASHLNALASPDEAIFYTSGRTSNEAAFLYQLFVREFGTNNLPDCSNMCHESSGVALTQTLGTGKGTVTLDDFNHAEVILILGQNPGTNHPRMLTALQKAKKRGAKIIALNPLPEAGLIAFRNPQTLSGILGAKQMLADLYLPVKINGDMALLRGIEKILLEQEEQQPGSVFDQDFIRDHTSGYEAFLGDLRSRSLEDLSRICGITVAQMKEAAVFIAGKKKIITCWAMGLTQHKNAVDTIKEIVNLHLLTGSIGKEGAGLCPVRGHSNVQGDRTMGINERPTSAFLDQLDKSMGIRSPRKDGFDVVESIRAMHDGRGKVFVALGGNFLSATPDTSYTALALRNCLLTVHISTKLNRSHLVHGKEALILPCLGRSDKDVLQGELQFVSCENSMSVVQSSKGNLEPVAHQLLSEPVIVCRLAQATLGARSLINWEKYLTHYDHIRSDIEKAVPGFDNYNQRVRHPGGFYLKNAVRERSFKTAVDKAVFTVSPIHEHILKDGEYMMMTVRSHDQFYTTIYGLNDRYRGIQNERRVIFMNEMDMQQAQLVAGAIVDLHNHHGGIHRVARKFVVVPYAIPEKCAATYFPETNVLVPIDSTADQSNTPTSKTVVIRITPHDR